MNMYNFIYCFFYKFWEKRGSDGRLTGSVHVLIALLTQILLIREIIEWITGYKIYSLHSFGEYGTNKTLYFFGCIPLAVVFFLFYNRKRTKYLLKLYHIEYGKNNRVRILCYFVLPIIAVITLGVLRQNFGNLSD